MSNGSRTRSFACPECARCGNATRLVSIEPHPRIVHTDLRSFVCETCNEPQVVVVPLSSPMEVVSDPPISTAAAS